jgi:hypothetical protein
MIPKKWPIRRYLRALHRDAGYLAIGLTFIYAVSGLAVNHIADWDPNFTQVDHTRPIALDPEFRSLRLSQDPAAARRVAESTLAALARVDEVKDVYAVDDAHVDITLDGTMLYVDVAQSLVREEGQRERFLLRVANWLHLNRGKKAWTFIADGYALLLLFLATSGLFMLPGKLGLKGRHPDRRRRPGPRPLRGAERRSVNLRPMGRIAQRAHNRPLPRTCTIAQTGGRNALNTWVKSTFQ